MPPITIDRRQFLAASAMALASSRQRGPGPLQAAGVSRELMAVVKAAAWINSEAIRPELLIGRVVLVDFWTYTCINWLRTLPYLRAWATRYRDRLTVIGVHTPEFSFEHDISNVRRAVQQMDVAYAVAIDNDYAIWRAFGNQFWPAVYLLDHRGRIGHRRFGESDYPDLERQVQRFLRDAGDDVGARELTPVEANGMERPSDWPNLRSPEMYLGHLRSERFVSRLVRDQVHRYALPRRLALNEWALSGDWAVGKEAARLTSATGAIVCRFHARDIHLVMGPSTTGDDRRFRVLLDGTAPGPARGLDVDGDGYGTVMDQRLYHLARQPGHVSDRTITVEFADGGVDAFSFTFG